MAVIARDREQAQVLGQDSFSTLFYCSLGLLCCGLHNFCISSLTRRISDLGIAAFCKHCCNTQFPQSLRILPGFLPSALGKCSRMAIAQWWSPCLVCRESQVQFWASPVKGFEVESDVKVRSLLSWGKQSKPRWTSGLIWSKAASCL